MAEHERDRATARATTNGGSGGVIAVLVVVVVLLVAGFLYFTRYGEVDDRPDIEIHMPAPDATPEPGTPPPSGSPNN